VNVAVVTLALSLCLIILSGQSGYVSASPKWSGWCNNYWYYNCYSGYYNYCPYYYYNYYQYSCYYGSYYNSYYGYPYYGYYYNTAQSQYQLTVATDPPNIGSVTGSGTYSQGTSASFSVTQNVVQVSQTSRYVFSHWSGDYTGVGTSGSLTINGASDVVAVYQLQYYLDVSVQPLTAPLPQGSGWYDAGTTVNLSSAGQMLGGQDGSRLVFQGWNVDGNSTFGGTSLMLEMNSPHTATTQYKQQYYLSVMTDQGNAYGQGWYDAGSTAQIYVSTPISTTYGVSILFNGWQGDVQSTSQSTTVLMDGPKTAIASWRTDSTVLYATIAVGVIALFLAGASILAYVTQNRNRYGQNTTRQAPIREPAYTNPTPSPAPLPPAPIKTKSVPRKKRMPVEAQTPPEKTDTSPP
jgi:hypothetical protein